jgi:hypothetical protein
MNAPDHFEIVNGRGFYRPRGSVSLDAAVDVVSAALEYAREQGARDLLVNLTSLTGFESPNLFQRFALIEKWVVAAGGVVRLAMVVRPELIDPGRFGVTVAANRGLVCDVFVSEEKAEIWLDAFR